MSICTLPNELLQFIASYIEDLKDLNALLLTCQHLTSRFTPVLLQRALTAPSSTSGTYKTRSVLHWAVAHNRTRLVEALLALGAPISYEDVDDDALEPPTSLSPRRVNSSPTAADVTPLFTALVGGNQDIVSLLLQAAGDATTLRPCALSGLPLIHCAILLHRPKLLRVFGDPSATTGSGVPALHYAVLGRCTQAVQVLAEMGADLGKTDSSGTTALQYARMLRGGENLVQLLGDLGAPRTPEVVLGQWDMGRQPDRWAADVEEIGYLQKKEVACRCCAQCGGDYGAGGGEASGTSGSAPRGPPPPKGTSPAASGSGEGFVGVARAWLLRRRTAEH